MKVLVLSLACLPALSLAFCPTIPTTVLGAAPSSCRALPRQLRAATGVSMQGDMWKRIGNLAKDKASGAKGWVDQGASNDKDLNVRGAGAGVVIGVMPRAPPITYSHPVCHVCINIYVLSSITKKCNNAMATFI